MVIKIVETGIIMNDVDKWLSLSCKDCPATRNFLKKIEDIIFYPQRVYMKMWAF